MIIRKALSRLILFVLPAISTLAQGPVTPSGVGSAENPYQISQLGHLVWMSDNVGSSSGKFYIVQNDIDASATSSWNDGKGFVPIGSYSPFQPFNGTFNGNEKTISCLIINRPSESFVGLFGLAGNNSEVKDLHLTGGAVTGSDYAGTIVGYNSGIVSECCAIGSVTGTNEVGGLVGTNWRTVTNCHVTSSIITGCVAVGGLVGKNNGTVSESHSEAGVYGTGRVGGLVGYNPTISTVSGCYATGPVTGTSNYVGGLVGSNFGVLRSCYATGPVSGIRAGIGGLVGYTDLDADVSNCYATGPVMGNVSVGGLIGLNYGVLQRCYATGSVTGTNLVGGLVGANSKAVSECYSAGPVTGLTTVGGLVGTNGLLGTVSNSYWDTHTSGQASSAAGTGRTTAEMKQQATFMGWDFANIWRIMENVTYPYFAAQGPGPLLRPEVLADTSFGMISNRFGFNINWTSGQVVVVDASTNLTQTNWIPLVTGTLSGVPYYFFDSKWTNHIGRFYRIRSP